MLTVQNHTNNPINIGDALAPAGGTATLNPTRLLNNAAMVASLRTQVAAGNLTVSRGSQVLTDAIILGLLTDEEGTLLATLGVDVPDVALGLYGDGNDGDVLMDGTAAGTWGSYIGPKKTYTLSRDLVAETLYVAPTYILNTAGFRVFSRGLLQIDGTVRANGNAGDAGDAGGAGGAAVAAGSVAGSVAGGAADAATRLGGASGNHVTTAMGGAGGAGGTGAGAAGTAGGTSAQASADHGTLRMLPAALYAKFDATSTAGANGGAGGSAGSGDGVAFVGGGGGGGGGVMVLAASSIVVGAAGVVSANGGAGGAGGVDVVTGGGGGGGGGGGLVIMISGSITETTGSTVSAAGGAAGAAGGPTGLIGNAGSAGTVIRLLNAN
jgi:hypothetical protein